MKRTVSLALLSAVVAPSAVVAFVPPSGVIRHDEMIMSNRVASNLHMAENDEVRDIKMETLLLHSTRKYIGHTSCENRN